MGKNHYEFIGRSSKFTTNTKVSGLRLDKYRTAVNKINGQAGKKTYDLLTRNCATQVSKAFNAAGVFNIPLPHPVLLEMQMVLRNNVHLTSLMSPIE